MTAPSIVFIAGARPNFMKVAPILRELAARKTALIGELVHTGQHYNHDMSGVFFDQLGMPPPDVHLAVGSGPHGAQTGAIMTKFEGWLLARQAPPRGVVVVGDVNSTMACALVAAKLHIPVAHVEAGLRAFDRTMPEEINRVVTDAVSDLLFVSEPAGLDNLRNEGIPATRVRYAGNVMIDSLVHQLPAAKALDMPAKVRVTPGEYAVVTLHRPSNVDDADRLRALVALVLWMADRMNVVFPVHPRTAKRLDELDLKGVLETNARVFVVEPLGYREFLGLMSEAKLMVTDSGGVQEETTYLGVPCITLRANTERPVTLTEGTNLLVGDNLALAQAHIGDIVAGRGRPGKAIQGWDGKAAARVIDALLAAWG